MQFSNLHHLHEHATVLSSVLPNQTVFLVGGAIRDLLLGTKEHITDIDITGSGTPDHRREHMHLPETERSRFRTEKFGTMTLVHKTDPEVYYEITPFREETGYADNRHPDQITWSNSLLADSNRRDFTINTLYRTQIHNDQPLVVSSQSPIVFKDDQHLLTILKQHGGCFLVDEQLIIVQDNTLIQSYCNVINQNSTPNEIVCSFISQFPQVISSQSLQANNQLPVVFSLLIDPHHGLNDLVNRKIRAVGDPVDRFTEDALRILRGLRFVNMLNQKIPHADKQNSGFDIEKKTRQGMEKTAPLVTELSAERLHAELIKVFREDNPFGYIALLRELQLLGIIFPALATTIDNWQPVRYHPFDTYNHTLLTLWHCQQLCTDPLVKLAMLYHDVGKPEQYAFMDAAIAANPDNPDRTGYIAHPEISVRLAKEDFGRLSFSKAEIEQICRYIKWHHRPGEILDSKTDTRIKKCRELLSDGGYEATINLFTIAIADRYGQYNPLQKAAIGELEELKELVTMLYETEGQFTMKQLAVNGNDLITDLALKPGPALGELLQKIFAWVMEDVQARNNKEGIYKWVKASQSS